MTEEGKDYHKAGMSQWQRPRQLPTATAIVAMRPAQLMALMMLTLQKTGAMQDATVNWSFRGRPAVNLGHGPMARM